MITDFTDRLTYVGTLDDVVERYPWPKQLSLNDIRHQLITSVIYGKKLLINDGYLVANPKLAGELKDTVTSLLGNLLRNGDARLFARGGITNNIAAGIENGARSGVLSHRELIEGGHFGAIRDSLEDLSSQIAHLTVPWPSDKNMGELFVILLNRVRSLNGESRRSLIEPSLNDVFDKVHESFLRELDTRTFNGARSVWEQCCWRQFGQSVSPSDIMKLGDIEVREQAFRNYNTVRSLMNVANEVYHLAYTVGAGHSIKQYRPVGIDADTSGVATAITTAFPELIGEEVNQKDSENLLDLQKVAAMNRLLISIPSELDFKGDFTFVSRIRGNEGCRTARIDYLKTLKEFIEFGSPYDNLEKECEQARDEYVEELVNIITPAIETGRGFRLRRKIVDASLRTAVTSSIDLLIPGIGKATGIVIGQIDEILPKKYKSARLIERILRIGDDHVARTALRRDGIMATQSADAYQLVRKLGFYLGPLKPDGIAKVAALAKPHPDTGRDTNVSVP